MDRVVDNRDFFFVSVSRILISPDIRSVQGTFSPPWVRQGSFAPAEVEKMRHQEIFYIFFGHAFQWYCKLANHRREASLEQKKKLACSYPKERNYAS